jgi:hypothetical protein
MNNHKILAFAVLMIHAIALHAQTERGKLWIAGSSQFGLNQGGYKVKIDGDESGKYSHFELVFQPKVGYTIINNLPIGIYLNFENSGYTEKESDFKSRLNSYIGGPFVRYYFADLVGLKPYAEALFGFGFANSKYQVMSDEWSENKRRLINFSMGAGFTYFFNDHIGIDLLLGYNYENSRDKNGYNEAGEETEVITIFNEFIMQMGIVAMIKCKR